MATKTSTKKTSAKKSSATKKKLVSIPQIYMDTTKSLSTAPSQIDIFGEDGEPITIKQTIGPWDIITLSNFCISYSSYKSGDTEIYDDRFFEYGYRLGILMYFTNLDIEPVADQSEYLVTGENAIFWPIYEQINEDTKKLVREACLFRRNEELSKIRNAASPLGMLLSQIGKAYGDGLKKYIDDASGAFIGEIQDAIEHQPVDNIVPFENGDDDHETSGESERSESSDEAEDGRGDEK